MNQNMMTNKLAEPKETSIKKWLGAIHIFPDIQDRIQDSLAAEGRLASYI